MVQVLFLRPLRRSGCSAVGECSFETGNIVTYFEDFEANSPGSFGKNFRETL
jgi:hypothetical protein